jgi:hypothetical protein
MILILLLIVALVLVYTREPNELVEVKEKYTVLRNHLRDTDNQKYHMLHRCIPITGMKRMNGVGGFQHKQRRRNHRVPGREAK